MVPFDDSIKDNKDANLFNKILAAANNPDVRQNFVFWSDDQILTDYIDLNQLPIVANNRGYKHFQQTKELSKWQARMKHTLEVIKQKQNKQLPCNYDSHVPQLYNKTKVKQIFSKVDYNTQPGLCINTIYFGLQKVKSIDQRKVKHTIEGVQKPLPIPSEMSLYIGYDEGAWRSGLALFLLGFFFNPCPYQKSL